MLTLTVVLLLVVLYHYFFYPALVIAWSRWAPRPDAGKLDPTRPGWPKVTLLIAAFNEEKVIAAKLRNALALDYPHPVEVIVVSDGSNDGTRSLVESFADQGVRSLHQDARRGKTAALNRGVASATGDVIVFSDANNDFNRDALLRLVEHFADPGIGGVCGVKKIKPGADRESTVGDGLYWKYESAIKLAEGRIGSITNADGEIFAMRRGLWRPIPEHVINDDAQITFDLVDQGQRIVYEPRAMSWEHASISIEDDFWVKVRMIAGGFQTLAIHWRRVFFPTSQFYFFYFSHKVLRYLMPQALLLLFVLSGLSAIEDAGGPFTALFVAQCVFYGLAAAASLRPDKSALPKFLYVPYYFTTMNIAAFLGLVRFLSRRQGTNWRKAAR